MPIGILVLGTPVCNANFIRNVTVNVQPFIVLSGL